MSAVLSETAFLNMSVIESAAALPEGSSKKQVYNEAAGNKL